MNDTSWFEDVPSKEATRRVLNAADIELERFARVAETAPRRNFFSFLSAEVLGAIPVAGIAAALGFWIVFDNESHSKLQVQTDVAASLIDDPLQDGDDEIVTNLEFFEDFELLEELKDEELPS